MPPQSPSGLLFENTMNSVTITLNEDGTYSVSSGQEDMTAEGMPMAEPQSFATADEACDAAIAMLGGSEEEEPMIEGEEDLQAQFEGGFKQARGM
jgi:hypothetical protein